MSHPPLPTEVSTEVPGDSESDPTDTGMTVDGMVACRNVVIGDLTIKPSSVTTTTIVPVWKKGDVPIEFYRSAFPDDRAFRKCSSSAGREVLGKITFVQAVQFLTETSTSYDTGAEPIRTVENPAQTTDPKPIQSATSIAKNIVSSDAGTTASKIIAFPSQSPATSSQTPQIIIGDTTLPAIPTTLTASADSGTSPVLVPAFVIGTQTITLGTDSAVTIGGTPVAVQTSNGLTFAVVGDSGHASTVQLSQDPSKSTITPPPILVGGTTISPSVQTITPPLVISGQTLIPGEAVILTGDDGAIVALATDSAGNSILVAGGKTTTLASGVQSTPIILAGYTFAPQSALPGYVISGQSLTFGGSVTIQDRESTKIVLLTTNSLGQTLLISNGQSTVITSPVPTPLNVNGITISPIPSSSIFEYHISDKILTMGGTITIGMVPSQTILVLSTNSAGQSILIENGKTTTISSESLMKATAGTTSTMGIADVIGSVMGLSNPATKTILSSSVSFSLDSNVATGAPTPSSSGSDSLLISISRMLGVWIAILELAI
ncbi:putative glutamine-tRNA ligase [Venturia nashicola]|nr:putative glutamine-tRNA ligase [Venturia nashicola]